MGNGDNLASNIVIEPISCIESKRRIEWRERMLWCIRTERDLLRFGKRMNKFNRHQEFIVGRWDANMRTCS